MWFRSARKTPHSQSARRLPPSYRPHVEALEDRCLLSSGALDPTFGSGGTVTTSLTKDGDDVAHGILLQSNGDLIAYGAAYTGTAGYSPVGFGLARYTPSGSLDPQFGSGGKVTTFKVGTTTLNDGVTQAALQANGKIVTLGNGSYLVRYNSNGSLDTTFGARGLVTVPSGFAVDSLLILPSNGDIVVGGSYNSDFALLAYSPTGTLDSTFGSGGEVATSTAAGGIAALALANADIVAGGGSVLAKYTLSGSLDTTFGSGGIATSAAAMRSLLVQPNGQIVAVGTGKGLTWELARYNVNGSLDTTFGSGGTVITSVTGEDFADAAALQPNGQIVVVGWSFYTGDFESGVYNSNGSLDTSFGSGGFVSYSMSPASIGDLGGGVLIQPDGKIVTAGTIFARPGKDDFALARYGPSAAQIGSFTASPNPVKAGSNVTLTASNITLADPTSTITQVAFYVQLNGTNTLLGYGTQNSPGVWTLSYTVNLASGSYTFLAQALDSDGVLGDPVALSLQVQ
jgi:uncharacterized delta-60 repeat protein